MIVCGISSAFDHEKPKKLNLDKYRRVVELHPPCQGKTKEHGKELVVSMRSTSMEEMNKELEFEIICGLPCWSKLHNALECNQKRLRAYGGKKKRFNKSRTLDWKEKRLEAPRRGKKYMNKLRVLTKCAFGGVSRPKRLVDYNWIEVSKMVRAWNARLELNVPHPVFVRVMLRSHVTVGFSLRMPAHFCRKYLPEEDTLMTLETDFGEQYVAKYLPRNVELSAGWVRFAKDKKLVEGDRVVFHLVEATRFKVYIIRKGSSTVNLPRPLLNLYTIATQCVSDKKPVIVYKRRDSRELVQNCILVKWNDSFRITDALKLYEVENFKNAIYKFLRNHELPEITLQAYYKLCRKQNVFLHAHLLEGLNTRFFVRVIRSIICKTVSIATALENCSLSTFLDNYIEWDKSLTSYEALGMNVSFLLTRLNHLRDLAVSSEGAVNRSMYIEACHERQIAEFEVNKLETVLAKLRKASIMLDAEVKALESKAGWEKYLEAYSRLIQAKDEVKEIEVLVTDFGKFFEHYDAVIESLRLKASNHEHLFQVQVAAPW